MDGLQAQDGPGDGPGGSNSRVSYGFRGRQGPASPRHPESGVVEGGVHLHALDDDPQPPRPARARPSRSSGRRRRRRSRGSRRRSSRGSPPARAASASTPSARRGPSRRRPRRARTAPDFSVTFSRCAGPPGNASWPTSSTAWPLAFQSTSGPSMSACSAARRPPRPAAARARGRRRAGTRASRPSRPRPRRPSFPGTRTRCGCGRVARSRAARSPAGRGRRWRGPSCAPSAPPRGPPARRAPPRGGPRSRPRVCAATAGGASRATAARMNRAFMALTSAPAGVPGRLGVDGRPDDRSRGQ